jgi:hypothetical protein
MEKEMSMVEQVAKAIAETLMAIDQKRAENSGHDIMLVIDAYLPPCRIAARAAIEAMRTPTPSMEDAVAKDVDDWISERIEDMMHLYKVAIDAALKEEEQ